jgi:hypothetical protein
VVTGDMAGNAADGRAFKAALGVGVDRQCDCKRQSGAAQKSLHWQNSIAAVSIRGDGIRSRRLTPAKYPAAIVGLVPRTRSSHKFAGRSDANFGFKSGTTRIELLVSLSIPKFVRACR